MKARFIVFEGLDGSGKSTQLSLLSERLTLLGLPHIVTREPSFDNPVGLLVRDAVRGVFPLEGETLALLFAADRCEHVTKVILPALEQGKHVLCDRYYYSNFAYQGGAVPLARLIQYNAQVMTLLRPDLTLFLDVPPEECGRRLRETRSTLDIFEDTENLRVVRGHYMAAFEAMRASEDIQVISADGLSLEEGAALVAARVLPLLTDAF